MRIKQICVAMLVPFAFIGTETRSVRAQAVPQLPAPSAPIPLETIGDTASGAPMSSATSPQSLGTANGIPSVYPSPQGSNYYGIGGNALLGRLRNPFNGGDDQHKKWFFGYASPQYSTAPGGGGLPDGAGGPGPMPGTTPGAGMTPGAGAPGTTPTAGGPAAGAGAAGTDALGAAATTAGPGYGGALEAAVTPFAMIGDQGYFPMAARFPPVPGPFPPGRPVSGSSPFSKLNHAVNAIVPAVRGFKIADNQSPRPMDRVFVDFNYYNNVNSALNRRLGAPISNMQAYREMFGVEKTFFDGNASLGLRLPVNSLAVDSSYPGLGGTHSAFGNLAVFGKYVLYQDNRGNLLSAGLSIDTPTGPASFAGYPVRYAQNAVGIQPFLGYILKQDQWFLHGFGAIDVPTVSSMPTMMYLDAGLGYFLYRTQEQRVLTAIVPTYELHMNIPLNHSGYSNSDFYGVPPVLDMTFGVNFGLFNTSYLTAAYILPVTGPQPFSGEFALQLNFLFGRSRGAAPGQLTPPVTGG